MMLTSIIIVGCFLIASIANVTISITLSGIMGMINPTLNDIWKYDAHHSEGTCAWFGRSLFCRGRCPFGYDDIRGHSGLCRGGGQKCIPPQFGRRCWNESYQKRFCCKVDMNDCRWRGQWMSTALYANYKCQHYPPLSNRKDERCGELNCIVSHGNLHDNWMAKISGVIGYAICGQIIWTNWHGYRSDIWYKTKN